MILQDVSENILLGAAKMKNFFDEFKKFIARGNVIDLAVGLIMGSAFTAIVNALVNNVLMPILGGVIGGINLSNLSFTIPWSLTDEPPVVYYGAFLQAVINFIIIAFCIFLVVKAMNALVKKTPAEPPKPSKEQEILIEIRDLLKAQNASGNTEDYKKTK